MPSSTRFSPRSVAVVAAAAVVAALAFAACSTGTGAPEPTVSGAWVRPAQGMDLPAAGYMTISGGSQADTLLSVTSPAAATVEVHESSTDSSGMTGMHPIERLAIPAGETVTFEPGGYHLMLMGVAEDAIEIGKTVELRLTFENAGEIVVVAEVRAG